ncbi:16S rRNA (uracil(1498)-N(3))-methyltransferase [Nocardioides piscis]|uniref:Ribosomal RNA small subunit methyltransferase E n=1 Tax=Nocardioides piscis TaxID=2714938 RepID=A0A6G7YGQ3_9ACTN|nr:16S rRNA (uracil(1498)-N(3))-methyltransferase [Nocardioides piscis]QIK75995.1 16S rRNA (uracil(1498)-N(3))-methyltransferase [Nocardioides piscis]
MSLPVHLVDDLRGAAVGSTVEVTGDEAHHAVAVRRLRIGEEVVLTDGAGHRVVGVVASTGKRVFTATVSSAEVVARPEPSFTVVQALPKGDRGELAAEVLTEIGVETIVPWAASRSVAVWKGERAVKAHAKWQATAREAAKQSRRSWLPSVASLTSTAEVSGLIAAADLALVLHEEATTSLASLTLPTGGVVVVVVGPEGGVSPDELATFEAAGAVAVRLGAEVLRTSTAGLAAVSALLARTPAGTESSRVGPGYSTVKSLVSSSGPEPSVPPDGSAVRARKV